MNDLTNKLIIGTAQFKKGYGITNINKRINNKEIKKIFTLINENNIKYFDTAPFYGNSEKILGEYINQKEIVTKIPDIKEKIISKKSILETKKVLFQSIKNLKINNLYGVLLHSSFDLLKPGKKYLIDFLRGIKKDKITKKVGVSIYEKQNFYDIQRFFFPDIIQLPLNIIDRRLITNNFLKKIKDKKIEIHARSVFLQGILLENPKNFPPFFQKFKIDFVHLRNEIKKNKMSLLKAYLTFVLTIKEIDKIVIGIASSKQLGQILKIFNSKKIEKIDIDVPVISNKTLLDPRLWK